MQQEKRMGAPLGNQNAFKHGFYSKRFKSTEKLELSSSINNLQDEISLMKIIMRRVFERAEEEEGDLDTWFKTLSTLGLASTRLSKLIKMQKEMQGDQASLISDALKEALKEVTRELGT